MSRSSNLGEQLLLAGRQLGEADLRRLRGPVEILGPGGEPLLDLRLRARQRLRQRGRRLALPLGELASALVGDPALLLDEQRDRVGTRPGEHPFELGRALGGLGVDELVQPLVRGGEVSVDVVQPLERPPKQERARRRDRADEKTARRDGELALARLVERERHPGCDGAGRDEGRRAGEQPGGRHAERGPRERGRRDQHAGGERDVEDRGQRHRFIVRSQAARARRSAAASSAMAAASA